MTKTYRLTYESAEVMHALFDKASATQGWRISSRIMREYIEYFGPKTEQLDICAQEGKVIFTSFTEKIQDGKEVLKQPLETVITLHTDDFDDFHMQQDMHITISVRDFKAIVTHAETLHTPISAQFSYPTRPLQFGYQSEGMHCAFTLMTLGDYRSASSTPNPNFVSTRSASRQPSMAPAPTAISRGISDMPPPARPIPRINADKPLSSQSQRKPLRPERHNAPSYDADHDEESLFLPPGDDDQGWDPPNYEPEEEEMLGWDASNSVQLSGPHPTFRDSNTASSHSRRQQQQQQQQQEQASAPSQDGLEPTQRLSQVCPPRVTSNGHQKTDRKIAARHVRLSPGVTRRYVLLSMTVRLPHDGNEACSAARKHIGYSSRHRELVVSALHITSLVDGLSAVPMLAPTPC